LKERGVFDIGRFRHHFFVKRGAAGGVEQHHVVAAEAAGFERTFGDLCRLLALDDGQGVDADLFAEHRKLLHGGRAAYVEGSHQHLALLRGKAMADLGGGRGLAGSLQADQHDRHRWRRVEIDRIGADAQRFDQLVVNDLDDHLAGRDRLDHLDADGAFLYLIDKGVHDVERHVGLQQHAPHLAQRGIDVGLLQSAAPGQAIENAAELFRKIVEHLSTSS
jgi:hypothetical protein